MSRQKKPSEAMVSAYADTALHLLSNGSMPAVLLPEIRELKRRGGADRELAKRLELYSFNEMKAT